MTQRQQNEQYSEAETQQRFEKLVRSALNTRPKPLKSMAPRDAVAIKETAETEI